MSFRIYFALVMAASVNVVFGVVNSDFVHAAPITSGRGPGGIESTAGGAGTNLKLWFRAEDLQQSAGNVSQWLDASGNGYNASPGASAPVYTATGMNNIPAARFTGATTGSQILTVSSAAAGIIQNVVGVSMFTVVDHSAASIAGNQIYFSISTGDGSQVFRSALRTQSGTHQITVRSSDAEAGIQISASGAPVTPMVVGGIIDYPVKDGFRYTNGTLAASNTNMPTTLNNTQNTPSDIITIGNIGPLLSPSQQMVGDIGEVITFNRVVSQAERTIIDNYLSSKFNAGVTISGSDLGLATNDRYAGDTTAQGNYDFHVFGVGQAVTGGSQVLSTGDSGFGIDLTGSSLSNDNWVFAGRASLANTNSLTTADVATAGVAQRWQRDWYVDATGSFAATLAFNFADADLAAVHPATSYSLLRRAGLTGDYTNLGITAQLVGDTITFQVSSGALLDGYYTLGLTVPPPAPEPSSLCLAGLGMLLLVRRQRRK